jgi:hypothetical protein
MFSLIERTVRGDRSRQTRARRAIWPLRDPRWRPLVGAALLGAGACSGGREEVIAQIRFDAAAQDVDNKCTPTAGYEAPDMGLDLNFVLEHSRETTGEWTALVIGLGTLFSPNAAEYADSNAPEFFGMGTGFAIYPARMPAPQSCIDDCTAPQSCGCLRNCGCWTPSQDPQNGLCFCPRWPLSCKEADYAQSSDISRGTENPEAFLTLLATASDPATFDDPALYPALLASRRYRDDWEAQNPRRHITQVLVAKSLRFADCPPDDDLSDVVRALSGSDQPKTYVVPMNIGADDDDDRTDFNTLADAGRTEQAMHITIRTRPAVPPPNIQEPLAEVIRKIRAYEGRCEYLVRARRTVDFEKVNLTASSGGLLFKKVANHAACATNSQGWYYDTDDNPGAGSSVPTRIMACEGACRSLHGQGNDAGPTNGTARIQLGCPTVLARGDASP